MINIFDENGCRISPAAANKFPVGKDIYACMKNLSAISRYHLVLSTTSDVIHGGLMNIQLRSQHT